MQHYPMLNMHVDADQNNDIFEKFSRKAIQTVQQTLSHQDFLQSLHDMPLSEIAQIWSNR